ncbi:MAG: CHASE3 domain-containing protein, partial [Chthoniobacterales bacterium]
MNPAKLWLNLPLRLKALAMVAVPIAILLVALSIFVSSENKQEEAQQDWLTHTMKIRKETRIILNNLLDAEIGVRDYLATGHQEHLRPYLEAREDSALHLTRLRGLLKEELGRPAMISALEPVLNHIVETFGRLINARPSPEETQKLLEEAKVDIDSVRRQLDELRSEDDVAMESKQRESMQALAVQHREIGGVVVLALGTGWVAILLLTNSIVRRVKHVGENTRRLAQHIPLLDVPESEDEIGQVER